MYELLRTLNKELDTSIENTFSNDLLKRELDALYLKIQRYKTKEDEANLKALLDKLDSVLDDDLEEKPNNQTSDILDTAKPDEPKKENQFQSNQAKSISIESFEKEEILKDFDFDILDNTLGFRQLVHGFSIFLVIVSCLGFFVAIREKIYYNSRVYGELMGKKEVLIEEQKELKRKIESLQFQNNIMNYFDN